MQRIQIEVMLTALVVILGVALAGTWFESLREWVQTADFVQAVYVTLCVLASAALAGVGAGLKYGLAPGSHGAPKRSLFDLLGPSLSTVVTACLITAWAAHQMATIPATSEFQLSVLQVAQWLDIGILILSCASVIGITLDYRRATAQEQAA